MDILYIIIQFSYIHSVLISLHYFDTQLTDHLTCIKKFYLLW